MDILKLINTRTTPQTMPASPGQVVNNAGGYVFEVSGEERIRRFLTLGTDGTYYTGAKELTLDNAKIVLDWAMNRPVELVDIVVQVSEAGRAPKNDTALLALAAVASSGTSAKGRAYALAHLDRVARTGAHLFKFAEYVQQFRGWGRGLRHAVAGWYNDKSVDALAYQLLKYRQRDGWTHRDLLRLSHPTTADPHKNALYRYATKGYEVHDLGTPPLVEAFEAAQTAGGMELLELIKHFPLSWEMLPTEALNDKAVWMRLIASGRVPLGALIRQLPRLTRLGVLEDTNIRGMVAGKLTDMNQLRKARIHPVNVLVAQRTYASGQGKGSTWTPNRHITDALDAAFYAAFGTVDPAGKRTLIGLDVSGSMNTQISGLPITAREASVALSLVQLATEPEADIVAFTGGGMWATGGTTLSLLNIRPRQRLDDVCRDMRGMPFGSTDCSLPMLYAAEAGKQYDTFVIYTDNETYAGRMHPHQALKQYREKTGINAKLIVVGMTATNFTIADPNDAGMLDVAGFDSAVPNLISDFSRGL